MKWVFLIGSGRSGSTFLANIIRSHPRIEFYNDIFKRADQVMPNFQKSFRSGAGDLKEKFESDFETLAKYKFKFMNNLLHRKKAVKVLFFGGVKLLTGILSRAGLARPNTFLRIAYYMNLLHEPFLKRFCATEFVKEKTTDRILVKENQMRKIYVLFRKIQSDSRLVYLVRNPYSVVASNIKFRNLKSLDDYVPVEKRYFTSMYGKHDLVEKYFDAGVEHRLALHWRLENEFIYENLQKSLFPNAKVVVFEDFLSDMKKGSEEIFRFIGLDYSRQTEQFLRDVSQFRGKQKHYLSTFVDRRDAERKIRTPELTREQRTNVESVLEGCKLMDLWR